MDRITCPDCGEVHDLSDMQVAFDKPDAYFAVPPDEREQRVTVTADLADIDAAHYFLRGVLEIPVVGEPQPFGWGIWVTVSKDDFVRYAEACHRDSDGALAAFAGRVATQLPHYPQTLGVAVDVVPSPDGTRPTFVVTDVAHPLGAEQRRGIPVERVLEHLSLFIHPEARAPLGRRHEPTLAADGWELESGVERYQRRDDLYWIPEAAIREGLRVGDRAKAIFLIAAANVGGEAEVHGERMWVELDHVQGEGSKAVYSGVLNNDPVLSGLTRHGMRVWFRPPHVIDVMWPNDARASEGDGVVRCQCHGVSQPAYVCRHLLRGSDAGFHHAHDPGNPRPDAWCDACDAVLRAHGGEWTDDAQEAAGVTLVCGGSYDVIEERNRSREE